jgi:uncharacterized iron-regulated membrane protein
MSKPSLPRFRQFWILTHRWIGLTIGLVLAIYSFTGSLVSFAPELEQATLPRLYTSSPAPEQMIGPDAVYAAIREKYPDKPKGWILEKPAFAGAPYYGEYYSPEERNESYDSSLMVPFDPATGHMLEPWYWGEHPVSFVYRFHMSLFLDEPGEDVAGILAVILFFSAVTGIYLWWPRKWTKRAFRIRVHSGASILMYDLHNAGGLYLSIFLLILSLTGIQIVWSDAAARAIGLVTPMEKMPSYAGGGHGHSAGLPAAPAGHFHLQLDKSEAAALAQFPGGAIVKTYVPPYGTSTVVKVVVQPRDTMTTADIWLDGSEARILHVSDPEKRGVGSNLMGLAYPLHNGTAFGLPGRIAIVVIGCAPLMLFITGFWLWFRRRRSKAVVAARLRASAAARIEA